ncbi:MAG: glycosyltransferase family 4 protein [Lachnospiraceae bacterium]
MKKVLFITTISGFLQQFEMNDVAILQEAGYEVHYASNFNNPVYEVNKDKLEEKEIHLHHITIAKSPLHLATNIKAYFQIRTIIKREQITAVHCHNPMGGVVGRLAAAGKKVFVIYTAHGFHFYEGAPFLSWLLYFSAEKLLAKCTDRLITINGEDYRRACRFKLRKGGRVERIPGVGVKTELFAPMRGLHEQVREELEIEEDTFYILSVGELNANKNHRIVIEAMAKLPDEKIHYGICGRGAMEPELRKLAEKLGVANRVTLFGFRNDIPRMLAAADIFCFPSKREGLGVAAIEAMAAGIPMITSDCRGTREYMSHGLNGLVCKKGTAEEWAQAIRKLKYDPVLREHMSQECLKTAAKFDIAQTDKIMRKLYGDGKM